MKLQAKSSKEATQILCRPKNIYDVQLAHECVVLVDENENIVDLLPACKLTFTIEEAEEFVKMIRKCWPDAENDPYYLQGEAIYPIHVSAYKMTRKIDIKKISSNLTIYRYKVAGENIYGITTKFTDEEIPERYVEASLDGWERWLSDHKRILAQAWTARYA